LLPYKGGRFSALVIVPHAQLSPKEFATFLTPARWQQTMSVLHGSVGSSLGGPCVQREGTAEAAVACRKTLIMPKFELEYEKDLTDSLNAIGYPISAGLPDFCNGCALSYVIQKTYLKVDEKGTTAAAATGGAVATALPTPLVVDGPFSLALIDNATDA